jgi:hypothetical protein
MIAVVSSETPVEGVWRAPVMPKPRSPNEKREGARA